MTARFAACFTQPGPPNLDRGDHADSDEASPAVWLMHGETAAAMPSQRAILAARHSRAAAEASAHLRGIVSAEPGDDPPADRAVMVVVGLDVALEVVAEACPRSRDRCSASVATRFVNMSGITSSRP